MSLAMKISERDSLAAKLKAFIPAEACEAIASKIVEENVKLTITKKRRTKLGDYRAPGAKVAYHRISVNGDLNPYMFLLVLLHEFAHLHVWMDKKHRVKAHGEEWKSYYRELYEAFVDCFPEEVNAVIQQHFKNLKATTCNDPYLTKHLMHMHHDEPVLLLNDLTEGDSFEISGRVFKVLTKRRTRFLCKDMVNKKNYLVSGSALVTQLNK
jgi:predicted SprT family Zn-dependent metalloprotease